MRRAFALLLFCLVLGVMLVWLSAKSQSFGVPNTAVYGAAVPEAISTPTFHPTNITGYPCFQWFVIDDGVQTNSSVLTVPNKCTWNASTDFTNAAAAGVWPVVQANALNGKDVLYFDGTDDYLRCANLPAQTNWEYFIVASVTNYTTGVQYILGGSASAARRHFYRNADAWYWAQSGSAFLGNADSLTNTWAIFDVSYGTSARIITNNVLYVSATLGEHVPTDIWFGVRYGGTTGPGRFAVAEILVYATNFSSATAQRTNIYNYLKDKYAL